MKLTLQKYKEDIIKSWKLILSFTIIWVLIWLPISPIHLSFTLGDSMKPTMSFFTVDLSMASYLVKDYEVGDIIGYKVDKDVANDFGYVVRYKTFEFEKHYRLMHRIIAIHEGDVFTTKGDFNEQQDPFPVRVEDVQSKVIWWINIF